MLFSGNENNQLPDTRQLCNFPQVTKQKDKIKIQLVTPGPDLKIDELNQLQYSCPIKFDTCISYILTPLSIFNVYTFQLP